MQKGTPHQLHPLPPQFDVSPLLPDLTRAHFALGSLNGALVNIPNLDLLTAPLLTKEAVLSSRIEGTQATLDEVMQYEAEQQKGEKTERERDIREIINYRRAIRAGVRGLRHGVRLELVLALHRVLMESVRGATKERGRLRRTQVHIGAPGSKIEAATYVPPSPEKVPQLLKNWEDYLRRTDVDPLVQAAVMHYQFEAIHPFLDGNGRTGRLMIPMILYRRRLLSYPLLYMSEYLERNRREYYLRLRDVTECGEWGLWVKFFVRGIAEQSRQTQAVVQKMLQLYQEVKTTTIGFRSAFAVPILDLLFRSPKISFAIIRKHVPTGSQQTVYNLLEKFKQAGILTELPGRRRNRVFVFKKLLEIVR